MPKSNGSQPLATHPAPIGESGFAALGGITVQESVLPFAADFGRLILAFHKKLNPWRGENRAKPRNSGLTKSAKG
jgi:hypothetical protein